MVVQRIGAGGSALGIGARAVAARCLSLLVGLAAVLGAVTASAVIIDSGDGTGNTTAPADDPGWVYIAKLSGQTAVYLGDSWVLTADHVNTGPVEIDGTTYNAIPGSEVRLTNDDETFAELKLFGIHPYPDLPLLPIRTSTPPIGRDVIMVGDGKNRGAVTSWDPDGAGPVDPIFGYAWGTGRRRRWGTNQVDGYPAVDPFNTVSFYTRFDSGQPDDEAQGANGDSGGAVFVKKGNKWELAGLLFAVGAFVGQPGNTSLYGNVTYAADLSFYHDEIDALVSLPEPSVLPGIVGGVTLLLAVGRRRIRR